MRFEPGVLGALATPADGPVIGMPGFEGIGEGIGAVTFGACPGVDWVDAALQAEPPHHREKSNKSGMALIAHFLCVFSVISGFSFLWN